MEYAENILGTIGNTPMVKINKIIGDIPALVLAKYETFNPGNSVKDRMALTMIEDAEADGRLKPGGTIIEGTSGNTGMGLALAAIVKGYKMVCVISDKQSKEKIDILKAVGSKVIVCPTNVAPDDPRSYYSTSKRLAEETPNSWYVNQYDNLSNTKAHYESTGPEIWKQTDGKVTHFVVGVGTGGTISGVAKYLKEKNPNIKIWGVDTYGSVFKKYHETGEFDTKEIYSYITEGIGEDILPKNVDFSLIDYFEKVTDKEGAVTTRELAKKEGLFLGYSAGSAFAGVRHLKDQLDENSVVVVLFHDHGSRYVGKVYNDDWMRDRGFLSDRNRLALDLVNQHRDLPLVTIASGELISNAIHKMQEYDISQIPVVENDKFIGCVDESHLFQRIVENPKIGDSPVSEVMSAPLPIIPAQTPVTEIGPMITKEVRAVLVQISDSQFHIITRHDLIGVLC